MLVERYLPPFAAVLLGVAAALTAGSTTLDDGLLLTGTVLASSLLGIAGLWLQGRRLARSEAALAARKQEAARLGTLIKAAPDAWCGWSSQGTMTQSPNFCALLGLSHCERLEQIETALSPGDAAALHGAFARLKKTGQGFQLLVSTGESGRALQITGTRGEAPAADGVSVERFDLLWVRDLSSVTGEIKRQSKARSAAESMAGDLRTALDSLPCPVWIRGPDLSLSWCNAAYARTVEATLQDVVDGQRELTQGVAGAAGRHLAAQARESGAPRSETLHLVIAGQRRLVELTEVPVPVPDEAPLVIGYALDRTREEELGTELSRHVSAHAKVLEQLGSGIAIFGSDTRLKFYNQAYQQLWGFDEGWLETEPTYSEVLEDLRARRRLPEYADFRAFKKEQLSQFTSLIEPREDMIHLPDGMALRMLVVPHPFGGLMLILEDVTNALALETSYNTLMAVQQETLDNLAEGIAVFGGDGRLKLSNPAYARIWRLDPQDLQGEPHVVELAEKMKEFFDYGEDWAGFKEEMIGNTLDRTSRSGRIERADGSVIEFANVPLPDGAVLNSFLDVTDSVRVEQVLRERNAALEAADRLKAEFIANVSYQLRTPLNAIMGFAEILANQYFGPLNERQMEYCRAVLDSGNRLLLLINDILDLATVEAGFMVLERGPVDLCNLLDSVVSLTREWARKQELILDVEADADLGIVEADEKRLKQALFNLISNAIKFTPAGGRITVGADRDSDWVTLWVRDNGIGIPDADQKRVLERFERANPQARQAGAGLGLSLVKSFIELHGGKVEIDSRVHEGTTVRCLLPAHSPAPAPSTEDVAP